MHNGNFWELNERIQLAVIQTTNQFRLGYIATALPANIWSYNGITRLSGSGHLGSKIGWDVRGDIRTVARGWKAIREGLCEPIYAYLRTNVVDEIIK